MTTIGWLFVTDNINSFEFCFQACMEDLFIYFMIAFYPESIEKYNASFSAIILFVAILSLHFAFGQIL